MSFISLEYFVFFIVVIPLYFAIPHRWRWLFLLVTSYFFYAYWNSSIIIILLSTITIDYFLARAIHTAQVPARRKLFLAVSLTLNLSILFVFKYFNFFNQTLASLAAGLNVPYHIQAVHLLLPVGISFYTFEEISYIIDVYRGRIQPERRFGIFANFIIFFPKLVAGPIERAGHLMPQFDQRVVFDSGRVVEGLRLILWGAFKKVVIADRLAIYVNAVYNDPTAHQGAPLLLATLFFAFQIYCDFSGYSDIGIGTAKVIGFQLLENFRQPYLSLSIREFWQRWHISLSTWFRDYLYIPLGGNRVPLARNLLNLMIVFLVSGLWHGASWTFVIWGALHGLFIVVETLLAARDIHLLPERMDARLRQTVRRTLTFGLVCLAWVFFRANSVEDAGYILSHFFSGTSELTVFAPYTGQFFLPQIELAISILLVALLLVVDMLDNRHGLNLALNRAPGYLRWGVYYMVAALIGLSLLLYTNGAQPFIYFQF